MVGVSILCHHLPWLALKFNSSLFGVAIKETKKILHYSTRTLFGKTTVNALRFMLGKLRPCVENKTRLKPEFKTT